MSTQSAMERRIEKNQPHRLSRQQWLSIALDILAREGGGTLSIENLVSRLGVSRGSFYWHFIDREEFVVALSKYWAEVTTHDVPARIEKNGGTVRAKMLALINMIIKEDLSKYDIAIRAWAAREPAAQDVIAKVDRFRFDYVRSLFLQMGFIGEELEVRTRTFVVYFSMSQGFLLKIPTKKRKAFILQQLDFFTRP